MENNSYLHATPPAAPSGHPGAPRTRLDALIIRVRTWFFTSIALMLIVLVAWATMGVASTIQRGNPDVPRVTTSADVELVKRARLCPEAEAAARVVELAPGLYRVQCWDGGGR